MLSIRTNASAATTSVPTGLLLPTIDRTEQQLRRRAEVVLSDHAHRISSWHPIVEQLGALGLHVVVKG